MNKPEDFISAIHAESICDQCGQEMELVKKKKKNHFSKESSYYKCDICDTKYMKRTLNEVTRDLGLRK